MVQVLFDKGADRTFLHLSLELNLQLEQFFEQFLLV